MGSNKIQELLNIQHKYKKYLKGFTESLQTRFELKLAIKRLSIEFDDEYNTALKAIESNASETEKLYFELIEINDYIEALQIALELTEQELDDL